MPFARSRPASLVIAVVWMSPLAMAPIASAQCREATNPCTEMSAGGGCSDAACCDLVCGLVEDCCAVAWDADCVQAAFDFCGLFLYECKANAKSPANDCASDATVASLNTIYAFTTSNATTDGPQSEPCDQSHDIWYVLFVADDGDLIVDVRSPDFDSVISIYGIAGPQCFDPALLPQHFIRCVDVRGTGGELATVPHAAANDWYLVRIGGYAGQAGPGDVEFRFRKLLYDTGNTFPVLFDAADQGNYTLTNIGLSSGNLDAGSPQRWTAQAFTLNDPVAPLIWSIESIHAYGFSPSGAQNDTLDFVIYTRDGFANPNSETQLFSGSVPFPIPLDIAGGGVNEDHEIDLAFTPVQLFSGDYWLTVFAGGAGAPTPPASFAWFINAQAGIPTVDAKGVAFAWRSHKIPTPGYQPYTLPTTTLTQSGTLDPVNLYAAGFRLLGAKSTLEAKCSWDLTGDGVVDGADLGVLLGAWQNPYRGGELGELLGAWGPCPGPGGDPPPAKFIDLAFSDRVVKMCGPAGSIEVVLNGILGVGPTGQLSGTATAVIDGTVSVSLIGSGPSLSLEAGGISIQLGPDHPEDVLLLNGVPVARFSLMKQLHIDVHSGLSVALWHPTSQCLFALSALGMTSEWAVNVGAARQFSGDGAVAAVGFFCTIAVNTVYATVVTMGCGTIAALCTGATLVTIGGMGVPCAAAVAFACAVIFDSTVGDAFKKVLLDLWDL